MLLKQKPTNREALALVGECLKILMLLQTLSKATECQKGLMNLLLETIVLVFMTLEDDLSQVIMTLFKESNKFPFGYKAFYSISFFHLLFLF